MQGTMIYAYVISKLTLCTLQGSRACKFAQSSGCLMKQSHYLGHF